MIKKSICLVFSILILYSFSNGQIINVFAGNHTCGYSGDGGSATSAQIFNPMEVAVDNFGSVYIADSYNNVIRKVAPSGTITTIAGHSCTIGYGGDGGPATIASLLGPNGVTIDGSGNIYIADNGNSCIRKIDTYGIITTIAGVGPPGPWPVFVADGEPATAGPVGFSANVAVDAVGNVYFSEYDSHIIRKINNVGIISTVAGNGIYGYSGDGGNATDAKLCFPTGLTIDISGNIYIADNRNNVIRKVNTSGIISTIVGTGAGAGTLLGYFSGNGGLATSAELDLPEAVAVDASGNLYISDCVNQQIRIVSNTALNESRLTTVSEIKVFPNPTIDELHIYNIPRETVYSLINSIGNVEQQGRLHAGNNIISTGTVPSGLYILKLSSREQTIKIVKE